MSKEFDRYAAAVGYPVEHWSDHSCSCGNERMHLYSDDIEGGAFTVCPKCGQERDLFQSKQFSRNVVQNTCTCDSEEFVVSTGQAFYQGTADPRWTYIAATCPKCGLAGVYVDWQER